MCYVLSHNLPSSLTFSKKCSKNTFSLQKVIRPSFTSFIARSVTSIIVLPFHTLRRGSLVYFLPKCSLFLFERLDGRLFFESCLIIPNSLGKCHFTLILFFLKRLILSRKLAKLAGVSLAIASVSFYPAQILTPDFSGRSPPPPPPPPAQKWEGGPGLDSPSVI